jgi:hypothetical protein
MGKLKLITVKLQEKAKRRKYWLKYRKTFKPTKAQLKTGSWYYQRMQLKYQAYKYGLKFALGFRPVLVKGKRWFVAYFGGAGEDYTIRLIAGKENAKTETHQIIFYAGLSFEPKTVVINTLQGKKGQSKLLKEFQTTVGMHYADFIVSEIESQAKRIGYKQVVIPNPEELDYYKEPYKDTLIKQPDGSYKIKKTRPLKPNIPEEKAEINRIRENIRKLYLGVINNRSFVREGNRFVKKL